MGTLQFPDLGKHCTVGDCKQLDFLPFTCDRCRKVFCLEHRGYVNHQCPNANEDDVTVVICPLCAKGVRLAAHTDPNMTWECHVNAECNPSNYEIATKKKKCPVSGCRELLTLSNTVRCRDCTLVHCLKHRFGSDHNCHGPSKPEFSNPLLNMLRLNRKQSSSGSPSQPLPSSSTWIRRVLSAGSSFRAVAEVGMMKLSGEVSQVRDGNGIKRGSAVEECPQCGLMFDDVMSLVDHVKNAHERKNTTVGVPKMTVDVCPKCSEGFRDPVSLVQHIETRHGGTSKS